MSWYRQYTYMANFYRMAVNKTLYFSSKGFNHDDVPIFYVPTRRTIIIGTNFIGAIREIKIWNSFLSPGLSK